MNFNGQLKKRNVNLGGGFKNNRANILQHTQKEREKRERERAREKSVIIVQSYIRRYQASINHKILVGKRWENLVTSVAEINYVIHQFTIFYSTLYKVNERKLEQLNLLCGLLKETNPSEINTKSFLELASTIVNTFPNISLKSTIDLQVLDQLLWLSDRLYSSIEIQKTLGGIIPELSKLVESLISSRDFELASKLVFIISKYAPLDVNNYIRFLSTTDLLRVPSFKVRFDVLNSQIESSTCLLSLSDDEKLNILSTLITQAEKFSIQTISPISWVLSSINVTVATKSENEFSMDEDDENDGNDAHELKRKLIDEDLNESIKRLYNREFITAVTKNVKDSHVLTRLYGSLMRLKPLLKSTFIIYLIPNSFKELVDSVLESSVFTKFIELQENSIYNIDQEFIKFVFQEHMDFLQYDLYIFFEVFQYFLIVSNDFEIFKKYDFTVKKFELISIFLKKFTFNLIWNSSKVRTLLGDKNLDLLETLSIKVLNQVYLKDSRLSLVDKTIWLINDKKLDIMTLVNLISQYEESRKNDYDSDNGAPDFISSLNSDSRAKLKIFLKTPFFISFEKRVEIFQVLVDLDRDRLGLSEANSLSMFGFLERKQTATIRREHMLEDAYDSFNKLGETFKSKLGINFINEHGEEVGVDGGGLTKEFLTGVVKEGFKDLFVENDNHELYPNPQIGLKYQYRIDSEEQLKSLNYTNFLGKVIGKCLYERVLVDISFSSFFLTKFNTGYKNSFDDLRSLDGELYTNLVKLLSMTDEELEGLNLTFSIDEKLDNRNISIDLVPNGSITPVTSSNKLKFVHEVANFKLNRLINIQCNSFLNGLFEIISKEWLAMFNPYELQMLISGEKDINVQDLKEYVVYGGYTLNDKTIRDFWEIVHEMTNTERFQLVKFVTSVPRAPLLGFKALVPRFGIKNGGDEPERLPTSSTCVNLLKLPNYRNKQLLKEKLLYAINAEAGFDLT